MTLLWAMVGEKKEYVMGFTSSIPIILGFIIFVWLALFCYNMGVRDGEEERRRNQAPVVGPVYRPTTCVPQWSCWPAAGGGYWCGWTWCP